ncbi:hypothetical protein BDR06DRAFT_900075, partial [Suillus hirtellus]
IFDPIQLTQMITAYADIMKEDRVIVVLDQGKTYNKIYHNYLIETLCTSKIK